MKDHGLPSRANRNSGSKVNRFPIFITANPAGLFNENVGRRDIPLLVAAIDPPKCFAVRVLSPGCACPSENNKRQTEVSKISCMVFTMALMFMEMFLSKKYRKSESK